MRGASRVFLARVCATLLIAPFVHAQTILGTWQATLPDSDNHRIAFRITRGDSGSLRGGFYRIGPDAADIPFSSLSFQPPDLNLVIGVLDTTYKATLHADGKAFEGIWTQGKQTYPLTFALATPETLWKRNGDAALAPMAETADPSFEVAVIKPSQPPAKTRTFNLRSRHFNARNATVADMMQFAYSVRTRQIEGEPPWADETKFDLDAEPNAEGMPSEEQDRLMVGKLLADRFQLKFHTVERIVPGYALTIEGSHPKLNHTDPDNRTHASIFVKETPDGQMLVQFTGHTMPNLADVLMNFLPDRQIVDETGLQGRFDFDVTILASVPDPAERAADIVRGMQTLGFRLVPKKAPIQILVIDHVEKPSEN